MRIAKKVERWRRETTPGMSTLRRLVVRCLIIYVFPIYVRAFFVTPSTSCLPRHQALHFISPIPPPRIGPYQVFFFGGLELIYMRAALRSALIATGGHLGIKKCQTTGHSPFSKTPAQPKASPVQPPPNAQSPSLNLSIGTSQRSITTTTHPLHCQSKIVLCTSCFGSILRGVSMLMVPPSQPKSSFLLRNHRWLCGRK